MNACPRPPTLKRRAFTRDQVPAADPPHPASFRGRARAHQNGNVSGGTYIWEPSARSVAAARMPTAPPSGRRAARRTPRAGLVKVSRLIRRKPSASATPPNRIPRVQECTPVYCSRTAERLPARGAQPRADDARAARTPPARARGGTSVFAPHTHARTHTPPLDPSRGTGLPRLSSATIAAFISHRARAGDRRVACHRRAHSSGAAALCPGMGPLRDRHRPCAGRILAPRLFMRCPPSRRGAACGVRGRAPSGASPNKPQSRGLRASPCVRRHATRRTYARRPR